MQAYKWLFIAPFPVWIVWGLAARVAPQHALDYFPFFWMANDVAIVLFFFALLLWVFGYGKGEESEPEPAGAADEPVGRGAP